MAGQVSLRDIYRPLPTSGLDYPLTGLHRFMEAYDVNLDPDYQRAHVWTLQQRRLFMGHFLEGGYVAPLIINEVDLADGFSRFDVVDGKQRLQTALLWIDGKISAKLSDGRNVRIGSFVDEYSKGKMSNTLTLRFNKTKLDRAETLELYYRLNRGGTVHSAAEMGLVKQLIKEERKK